MEIVTLEELLETLKEGIEAELNNDGLASWSIESAGENFTESLKSYPLEDLRDLKDALLEGSTVEVTIDLSAALIDFLTETIDEMEIDWDEEDSDNNEEDYYDDDSYSDDDE